MTDSSIYRERLNCNFKQIDDVFADCIKAGLLVFSETGIEEYLSGASLICMIGRGVEPVLVYLEEMPEIVETLDESMLNIVSQAVWKMSRTPNGKAIIPFMQTLPQAARRLGSSTQFKLYLDVIFDMMERTTGSIHGFHQTMPSPGLSSMLTKMPFLLDNLPLSGLKNWIDYGIKNHHDHPQRQQEYFALEAADSRAILQSERHGLLFADVERKLHLYLKALWEQEQYLAPYSESFGFGDRSVIRPYFEKDGIRIPDVYEDTENGVKALDRYRTVLAHMVGHMLWTKPMIVDNFSPHQRIATETLEDTRVDHLLIRKYPGFYNIIKKLHPVPIEHDCDEKNNSCVRHRLTMLSYAILNPEHGYENQYINEFAAKFHQQMAQGESSSEAMSQLAVSFIAKTRRQEDQSPYMFFKNTDITYRDDNRHMWVYIEEADDEEFFNERKTKDEKTEQETLLPRHYQEWDYQANSYRPDWVSLYENLHRSDDPLKVDKLLLKHASIAKRLKQILDILKPQNYVRVRYQEEGSELDLDVAIRSLIDYKAGSQPDPRINMSHQHDGRDIAVMLLLDLSESLNEIPHGASQTILELSQEAVSLLAWAIDKLGDKFAIAGFYSNTRHDVRYQHIKGFSESFDAAVKGRIAAMEARYSTRMGAAIRHAAHYLEHQKADKKLLLILTDGEPADIDVKDEEYLHHDSKKAIVELGQKGIYTYAISLDPRADEYVSNIFGKQYTVIENVNRLPEKLPQIFLSLTG